MRSKALVGFQVLGCALALVACGGGGDDDSGGGGTSGNATTNPGTGGMGSATTNPGTGGMGSSGMHNGTGGMGSGMNPGTGGMGSGMHSGTGGMGGNAGDGGGTGGTPATADCSMQGAALPDGMCKKTSQGVYAIKTDLDVWWKDENNPNTPIVNPGRGTITIYLMGDLTNCDDGKGVGTLHACGSELPAFVSDTTCDAYQLQFADEIWDKPDMPRFTTTGTTSGFNPGDTLTIAMASGLVGMKLDDTTMFPTPDTVTTFKCNGGMGTGLTDCFPDQDGDGNPGITVDLKLTGSYEPPNCGKDMPNKPACQCNNGLMDLDYTFRGSPTSLDLTAGGGSGGGVRTKQVFVGLLTTLGGMGTIADDCMSGMGDGIAPEDAIKSRVAACTVDPSTLPSGDTSHDMNACSGDEATFVDQNVPNYHVLQKDQAPPDLDYPNGQKVDPTKSMGPKSSVKRLGDLGKPFTCVDARNAFK